MDGNAPAEDRTTSLANQQPKNIKKPRVLLWIIVFLFYFTITAYIVGSTYKDNTKSSFVCTLPGSIAFLVTLCVSVVCAIMWAINLRRGTTEAEQHAHTTSTLIKLVPLLFFFVIMTLLGIVKSLKVRITEPDLLLATCNTEGDAASKEAEDYVVNKVMIAVDVVAILIYTSTFFLVVIHSLYSSLKAKNPIITSITLMIMFYNQIIVGLVDVYVGISRNKTWVDYLINAAYIDYAVSVAVTILVLLLTAEEKEDTMDFKSEKRYGEKRIHLSEDHKWYQRVLYDVTWSTQDRNRTTLLALSIVGFFLGCICFWGFIVPIYALLKEQPLPDQQCKAENVKLFDFIVGAASAIVIANSILLINQPIAVSSNKLKDRHQDQMEMVERIFMSIFFLLAVNSYFFDLSNTRSCDHSTVFTISYVLLVFDCFFQSAIQFLFDPNNTLYQISLPVLKEGGIIEQNYSYTYTDKQTRVIKSVQLMKGAFLIFNLIWNIFIVIIHIFAPWELTGNSAVFDQILDAGRLAFRLHIVVNSANNIYTVFTTSPNNDTAASPLLALHHRSYSTQRTSNSYNNQESSSASSTITLAEIREN